MKLFHLSYPIPLPPPSPTLPPFPLPLLPPPALVIPGNKWPLPQMNFYIRGDAVCSRNGAVSLTVLMGDRYTARMWVYCSQQNITSAHAHTLVLKRTHSQAFRPYTPPPPPHTPPHPPSPLLLLLINLSERGCSNKILVPW